MAPADGDSPAGGSVVAPVRRKTKRQAAVARSKPARKAKLRNDTRTADERAIQTATAQHTRSINAQRRKAGRERTAVARTKAQIKKVAAAVAGGILLPDAPEILTDPIQPLSMDAGPMVAAKLKGISARLRDASLRGDKDPVTGRSLIPPSTLISLPGVQALSLAVRFLPGGRDRFIEYIQLGALNADQICLQFWQVWAELTPAERQIASFDDVIAAADLRPADLLAAMVKHAVNYGLDVARLISAAAHPQVQDAHITSALKQDSQIGQTDRLEFLRAAGSLPLPVKGALVNVNATANAGAIAAAASPDGAAMLSSFQQALQAAGAARDAVIDAVIIEHDERTERAGMRALKQASNALAFDEGDVETLTDPFKAAISAGVDAREPEKVTVATAILGQRVG